MKRKILVIGVFISLFISFVPSVSAAVFTTIFTEDFSSGIGSYGSDELGSSECRSNFNNYHWDDYANYQGETILSSWFGMSDVIVSSTMLSLANPEQNPYVDFYVPIYGENTVTGISVKAHGTKNSDSEGGTRYIYAMACDSDGGLIGTLVLVGGGPEVNIGQYTIDLSAWPADWIDVSGVYIVAFAAGWKNAVRIGVDDFSITVDTPADYDPFDSASGSIGGGGWAYPLSEVDHRFYKDDTATSGIDESEFWMWTDWNVASLATGTTITRGALFEGASGGATVLSPLNGVVVSLDSSSGSVVIADNADPALVAYHVTLEGLLTTDVSVGDSVGIGCPVGSLGQSRYTKNLHTGNPAPYNVMMTVQSPDPDNIGEFVYEDIDDMNLDFFPECVDSTPPPPSCINDGVWFEEAPGVSLPDEDPLRTYPLMPVSQYIDVPEGEALSLSIVLRSMHGPVIIDIDNVWFSSELVWANDFVDQTLTTPAFPPGRYKITISPQDDPLIVYPYNQTFIESLCVTSAGETSKTCVTGAWYSYDDVEIDSVGVNFEAGLTETAWLEHDLTAGTWIVQYRATSLRGPNGTTAGQLSYDVTTSAAASVASGSVNLAALSVGTNWETFEITASAPSADTYSINFSSLATNTQNVIVDSEVCFWLESEEILPPGVGSKPIPVDCDALLVIDGGGWAVFESLQAWIGWLQCHLNNWASSILWWLDNFFVVLRWEITNFFTMSSSDKLRWALLLNNVYERDPFGTSREVLQFLAVVQEDFDSVTFSLGAGAVMSSEDMSLAGSLATNPINDDFAGVFSAAAAGEPSYFDGLDTMFTAQDFGTLSPVLGPTLLSFGMFFGFLNKIGVLGVIKSVDTLLLQFAFLVFIRKWALK